MSNSLNLLNRLRRIRVTGEDPPAALGLATVPIGSPLIVIAVVPACGLGVTALSELPALRLLG